MKNLIMVAATVLGFAATPAMARQNPEPPPSGIVVHLFGQNSIMSNVLPSGPQQAPGTAGPTGQPASAYVEPSTHDILHQMFVTGDPNDPSKPAPGRVAERPVD